MTFQLPEPAQVVETRIGEPVYVMFKCEFTVQQNPEVTNNITRLGLVIHTPAVGLSMTIQENGNISLL